jgi:hypothetical protein
VLGGALGQTVMTASHGAVAMSSWPTAPSGEVTANTVHREATNQGRGASVGVVGAQRLEASG